VKQGRIDAQLLPSGVATEHYSSAVSAERGTGRPTAGYVGVLDERLDLGLVAGLAAALPDWEVQMVGPVAKIDPVELPTGPNIRYLGAQPYERLPEIMAGFDVALMPFALNEATRSISPTKTLEYLAAGLPVVSTRVADVVASYAGVVDLQDDAAGFAAACRGVVLDDCSERDRKLRPLLYANHWDTIARQMQAIITAALRGSSPATKEIPA
jgi:glycosyltransferase involved in cell wall biosynthesis